MDSPFVGTIFALPYNFAPKGWAQCAGQLMSIQQNQALFALLGTAYGGNGTQNFMLPNLQSRVAIGAGPGLGLPVYTVGQSGGSAAVTLNGTNIPLHAHVVTPQVNSAGGNTNSPSGSYPAVNTQSVTVSPNTTKITVNAYSYSTASVSGQTAAAFQSAAAGGSQPLNIEPPYLCLNYCIAVQGLFPSRN